MMNRKDSRDRRYVLSAGVLLILGLMIAQSQPWRANADKPAKTFVQAGDGDYPTDANPRRSDGTNFEPGSGGQDSNYLGCFLDNNVLGKPRDLSGYEWSNSQMTTEQCVSSCKERGFPYAGTQYGSYCFCGSSYGRYGSLSGGEGRKCDTKCSGNSSQICGGAWANSVYSTTPTTSGNQAKKFVWERVGTGDCSGRDVGDSNGSTPDNNQAREGYTAVCWDGGTYRNSGRVFCTYKNIAPDQCTGGGNTGVMYRAVSQNVPGEPNANIAGGWESDYSHSWKPATIRQEGNRLWFTNEFNDTSEGVFESSSRVSATKWKLGATIQDGNTIKWDNGTTWRRRGGGPPPPPPTDGKFPNPTIKGYPISNCLDFGVGCGQPAADAFCRAQGFSRATSYSDATRPGKAWLPGPGILCNDPGCGAITDLICAR